MSAQVIGYLGENGVRDVRIPIGHLLDKWQGLRPLLVMVPVGGSDDEAYPVQYTLDGTDLVWHVSDADTAVAGTTKAAVRMVDDDGRVGMDEPFQVIISPNLSAGGEPPLVIKPWVDKLVTLVPRAESAVERAENAAQNWENGTAPNALVLDGKPPEYYLPAVNLLDNPDFAIAQAGYNAYHGAMLYAADRWKTGENGVLTVSGEVKTYTSNSGYAMLEQKLWNDGRDKGKTYTLAVELGDGTVSTCSGTVPSYDVSSQTIIAHVRIVKNFMMYIIKEPNGDFVVRLDATATGGTASFKHLRLFEGNYTAKALPPYAPKGYAAELLECQRQTIVFETDSTYETVLGCGYTDNTFARFEIDIPVPLRITDPSISADSGIVFGVRYNGTYTQVDSVTVKRALGNKLYLQANGSFASGHVATLVYYANSGDCKKIIVSADIK